MHPRWSMVTDAVGTGDWGKDPSSLMNTLARPPSAVVRTASWTTRVPLLILEHRGSAPIRIIGLPGDAPVRRIRPLIVPPTGAARCGLAAGSPLGSGVTGVVCSSAKDAGAAAASKSAVGSASSVASGVPPQPAAVKANASKALAHARIRYFLIMTSRMMTDRYSSGYQYFRWQFSQATSISAPASMSWSGFCASIAAKANPTAS